VNYCIILFQHFEKKVMPSPAQPGPAQPFPAQPSPAAKPVGSCFEISDAIILLDCIIFQISDVIILIIASSFFNILKKSDAIILLDCIIYQISDVIIWNY
jgi:hypothetical protein